MNYIIWTLFAVVAMIIAFKIIGDKKRFPNFTPVLPVDGKPIVGSWKITGGDYDLINDYRADGTMIQHAMGRTTQTPNAYRIQGDQLIITLVQIDGSTTEQSDTFKVETDKLTFFDQDGSKRVFKRVK